MEFFGEHGLVTDHPPIVGVGPHSGDPHYAPTVDTNSPIRGGDFVLIDLWAKLNQPRSIYSDLTRVGFVGPEIPEKYEQIFKIVALARDAGIQIVRDAFESRRPLCGFEVDDACLAVIDAQGMADTSSIAPATTSERTTTAMARPHGQSRDTRRAAHRAANALFH